MNRRILLAVAFPLALALLLPCAFAQAAAEAALTHAASAAATTKAGKALGSTLNKASQRLAGRVQGQVSQPARGTTSPAKARSVSTSPAGGTVVQEGTTPAQGPVIASIQGGATSCAPTKQTASTPDSKNAAESEQANRSDQGCARKPGPQKYESVITLSSSK